MIHNTNSIFKRHAALDHTETQALCATPSPEINLFDGIPPDWVADKSLIFRGKALLNELPSELRHLFNAVFSDQTRFKRFCTVPSSMKGHHAEINGNLKHTIETAEGIKSLCLNKPYANMGIAVLSALLHDVGKADEYKRNSNGYWEMTDRGKLLGHRVTVIEWISIAREKWHVQISEAQYFSLMHALTATPYAPAWMGLRSPVTPESFLLSAADRMSGQHYLYLNNSAAAGGWGNYHEHLKFKPFTVVEKG